MRFLRWFRSQDTGVRAAFIGLVGTLTAALITATVTLVVALNRPPGTGGSAPPATPPRPTPASDIPAPDPTTSTPHPAPPAPTTTPPSTPPYSPSPTPSPTVAAESRVRWRGTLRLDGTAGVRGWFFDDVPPGRAPVGDLAIQGADQLYGAYALVRWTGSRPPTRAECATLLGQQSLDVGKGDRACFGTENLRVGYAEVTGIPDADHIDLAVTVWQRAD